MRVYVLTQRAIAFFASRSESAVSQAVKRGALHTARMELEVEGLGDFTGITLESAARYFDWADERIEEIKAELDGLPSRIFRIRRGQGTDVDPYREDEVWFYESHPLAKGGTPPWEKS